MYIKLYKDLDNIGYIVLCVVNNTLTVDLRDNKSYLHYVSYLTVYYVHDVMDGCIVYVNDNDYYLD